MDANKENKEMTLDQKTNYLKKNHWVKWLKTYNETFDEVSDKQTIFCVCGKLATGLHESRCRRFQKEVLKVTASKLSDLITQANVSA